MKIALLGPGMRERHIIHFPNMTPELFLEVAGRMKENEPTEGYYEEWKKVGNEYRIYIRETKTHK